MKRLKITLGNYVGRNIDAENIAETAAKYHLDYDAAVIPDITVCDADNGDILSKLDGGESRIYVSGEDKDVKKFLNELDIEYFRNF